MYIKDFKYSLAKTVNLLKVALERQEQRDRLPVLHERDRY